MDGGKKADGIDPMVPILNTLSIIDKEYGTDWTFNKWVVTHWDEDHYEGVLTLLESNTKGICRKKIEKGAQPKPQDYTTFRNAYFCKEPDLYCGAKYDHLNSEKVVEKICNVVNLCQFRDVIPGSSLLRRDLFTGRFWPPDEDCSPGVKLLAGTNKTIHVHKAADDAYFNNAPHFTVLGAGGYTLIRPNIKAKVTVNELTFMEDSTISKNETSILSLLHWPQHKAGAYFTGGDGNPKAELEAIIPLLGAYEKLPVNTFKLDHHGSSKENIQKTNTQGLPKDASLRDVWPKNQDALNSNLKKKDEQGLEVVRQLQPRNILVTPGNQYGHPTYDVITLLSCCRFETGIRPVLHTTRSPYWMLKPPSGKDVNLGHFEALETIHLRARNMMFEKKALVTLLGAQAELHDEVLGSNEQYAQAYDEFKSHYQKFCGAKDPPTWLEAIAEVERQQNDVMKQLNKFYNQKNYTGEEPSWSSILDFRDIIQEYREQIQDTSTTTWGTLSGQKVGLHELPYYLVRFTFNNSVEAEIDIMDETGNIMPTEEIASQEPSSYSESDSEDEDDDVAPGNNKQRKGGVKSRIKKSQILPALADVDIPDSKEYKLFKIVYDYTEDVVNDLVSKHTGDKLVLNYANKKSLWEKDLREVLNKSTKMDMKTVMDEIHHHLRLNYFQRAKETRDIVDTPPLNAGQITYYLRKEDIIDIFGDTRGSRLIKPRKPKTPRPRKKKVVKK
ncbi:hypothetical protein AOL_s00176g66 [Orbilia oligospora ATCC 24927]|uniref:Uncharacterized protein n=2 Tax=Orbilia oligospora TaxID=2813651 RepID=G1XPU2_ARTOA|nr:hypothetical protein AOL_s00176g66 [Orbilia oligospora ATCC 24927]EGX44895.1 hypothetical protein AOL_s00176g66 [Orbilia oligospora ATCC 24927]KAF3284220.1 hypothetical protein TWF970_011440 [Orbilia oligospora]